MHFQAPFRQLPRNDEILCISDPRTTMCQTLPVIRLLHTVTPPGRVRCYVFDSTLLFRRSESAHRSRSLNMLYISVPEPVCRPYPKRGIQIGTENWTTQFEPNHNRANISSCVPAFRANPTQATSCDTGSHDSKPLFYPTDPPSGSFWEATRR